MRKSGKSFFWKILLLICFFCGLSLFLKIRRESVVDPFRGIRNITHLQFGKVFLDNATHLAMLVGGKSACNQAITMIKSLLLALGRFNATNPGCAELLQHYWLPSGLTADARNTMTMHLLVDDEAHMLLLQQFSQLKPDGILIRFYAMEQYMHQVKHLPSDHYSGSRSYIKLLLPEILPTTVEKVIMLDADMLLTTSIHSLWRLFDQFNDTQAIGMVQEQNPFFWTMLGRKYWPNLDYGYNAGLILIHLKKLRKVDWKRLWYESYVYLVERLGTLPTAEQDVLNRIVQLRGDMLFDMPCTWNVQLAAFSRDTRCPITWPFTQAGRNRSRCCGATEAHLMHFNSHLKPEASYPKPWQLRYVDDNGEPLAHIQRIWKYFKLYYVLRGLDFTCFQPRQ